MRRVAITGLGMISALGSNVADNWESLRTGRCGIGPITLADVSAMKYRNGAEIRGFNPARHFSGNSADFLDRFAQFAVVAAREAVRDAGLTITRELGQRMAIITGAAVGGQTTEDAGFYNVYRQGLNRVHPMTIPRTMSNAGASAISMEFGISGPVYTISTACSSANHAIGQAFCMVRSGAAEVALAGGSEAPFSFGLLKAWEAMRVISPDTCRPFSRDRKGMILGEGGAILLLEPLGRARARGARIYAEIVGFGMSSDAKHITNPCPDGAALAMQRALKDAAIEPSEVGYINAHGTGTPVNDPTETRAIRSVFSKHADKVMVSSTKSMHGHALGAAGALEAVSTVLALHHGIIPPTANFTAPDPECDLDVVANHARQAKVECALSNSFAFGGLNAVIAFAAAG